jgi:genome maintenance exonuclease 1
MNNQRKIFRHNLVPEETLTDQIIDGKRYYFLENGESFKSVTTILGERTDKSAIDKWRKRVGEAEANKITAIATRRGTSIHNMCERYVLNKENYLGDESPDNIYSFLPIQNLLEEHVDDILGIELPLYSRMLQTAGRSDLIANYDGQLSIIDFKTSTKPKKEQWIENYFLQSTVYSLMFEEMYNIKISQLAIMITVDHEHPQVFVRKTKNFYPRVKEIFLQK